MANHFALCVYMRPPTSSCTKVWARYTHLTYEETKVPKDLSKFPKFTQLVSGTAGLEPKLSGPKPYTTLTPHWGLS